MITHVKSSFHLHMLQISLIEPMTPQQEVADETIPEDSAPLWFQEIQTSTEETGESHGEPILEL